MSKTIKGEFFNTIEKKSLDEAINYLNRIGLVFGTNVEGTILLIEVRDKPEIISTLEAIDHRNNIIKNEGRVTEILDTIWKIWRIGEAGVSIYVTNNNKPADGSIFIPRENIVAIHTLDRSFIESHSDDKRIAVGA